MSIIDRLRTDALEWIGMLDNEELYAIRKYSYNSFEEGDEKFYSRLNAMLRGDLPLDGVLQRYSEVISRALKKSIIGEMWFAIGE